MLYVLIVNDAYAFHHFTFESTKNNLISKFLRTTPTESVFEYNPISTYIYLINACKKYIKCRYKYSIYQYYPISKNGSNSNERINWLINIMTYNWRVATHKNIDCQRLRSCSAPLLPPQMLLTPSEIAQPQQTGSDRVHHFPL